MTLDHWILGPDHRHIKVDLLTWAGWFEKSELRQVAHAVLPNGYEVSTIFLGIDHNFCDGPPILFETMTFPGDDRQLQERYATWDEAVAGHEKIAEEARWWTSRHITHFFMALKQRVRHWPYVGYMWHMNRWLRKMKRNQQ